MPSDYRDKKVNKFLSQSLKLDKEFLTRFLWDSQVWILCNDCNDTTEVYFHIIGQKCGHCRSYNTRAVAPPVLPQWQYQRSLSCIATRKAGKNFYVAKNWGWDWWSIITIQKKKGMINLIIGHKSKTNICLLHDSICCSLRGLYFTIYVWGVGKRNLCIIDYILVPGKLPG